MNIIMSIWNNWTLYEKLTTGGLLLAVLVIIPLVVLVFTKKKELSLIAFLSLLINGILVLISFVVLNQIFGVTITYIYKIVPLITLFANIFSIGAMTGYFTSNHRHRDFDAIEMKKETLRDNFKLTASLVLLLSGISILTPSIALLLLLSLGLSLGVIWINYALLYRIYK